MVAASILPVTIYKNQLYFLFGKENPMEDSSKGWSDFGGRLDEKETPLDAAIREGAEELSGFLGGPNDIKKRFNGKSGKPFLNLTLNDYHIHIFFLPYDKNLPFYYNKNHHFLWENMDKQMLNDSKLFEKIEIDWFSIQDMKRRRNEFRHFYREITDYILENHKNIQTFIKQSIRKKKTIKNRKKGMKSYTRSKKIK